MHDPHRRMTFLPLLGLVASAQGCVFPASDYRADQGEVCTSDDQCQSGHCADDVCCDRSCDAPCEACIEEITGVANGACAPFILGRTDPDAPACDDEGGCGVDNQCRCSDGWQGPGEEGVDCGGDCSAECSAR